MPSEKEEKGHFEIPVVYKVRVLLAYPTYEVLKTKICPGCVSGALLHWGCGRAECRAAFPQWRALCFCCVLAA